MTLPFPLPGFILCVKKHCCQQNAFFATNAAYEASQNAQVPPDHLRSEIPSRVHATFENIEKARKQEEAI